MTDPATLARWRAQGFDVKPQAAAGAGKTAKPQPGKTAPAAGPAPKPTAPAQPAQPVGEPTFGAWLQNLAAAGMKPQATATGLGSSVPSDGGFTVPPEAVADLWSAVYEKGQILSLCEPFPVTRGDELRVPAVQESTRGNGARFGTMSLSWTREGVAPSASTIQLRAAVFELRRLFGVTYATAELLQDAPALEAITRRLFGLEASFEVENAIVNGDGSDRPHGILSSDATITVAAEGGQSASTIVAQNVVNMLSRLWGPSHRRAVWLANVEALPQLLSMVWDSGSSVVPLFSYAPDGTPLLAGRPVLWSEYAQPLGARGDLILADFSQYGVADKRLRFESSMDARFIHEETAFRFAYRVDGHSLWAEPITPLNGSTTLSPFITLAERA